MPIVWKKRFKPQLILDEIAKSMTKATDGSVSFNGFDVYVHAITLGSMLDFPDIAEKSNKNALIWKALHASIIPPTAESFKSEINKALSAENSTSVKNYVLVSSISMRNNGVPKKIKVLDAEIEFLRELPKKFDSHYDAIKKHTAHAAVTPDEYMRVCVKVRHKSDTGAGHHASDRLDLLRGLISFYSNDTMQFNLGNNAIFKPINKVRCGAKHTIHTLDGKIAGHSIWFEPFFNSADLYGIKNPKIIFQKIRRNLIEISASPYKNELSNALMRYARAFDDADPNNAFLKLWSALESLTTPAQADYDKLIKRCSFLYEESAHHQQVLEHLREYRNKSVHSGIESNNVRTNCFQLQEYFRTALNFYLGHGKHCSSLAEANEFLDLPPDKGALESKIKSLRMAIKFVTPKL